MVGCCVARVLGEVLLDLFTRPPGACAAFLSARLAVLPHRLDVWEKMIWHICGNWISGRRTFGLCGLATLTPLFAGPGFGGVSGGLELGSAFGSLVGLLLLLDLRLPRELLHDLGLVRLRARLGTSSAPDLHAAAPVHGDQLGQGLVSPLA